MLEVVYVKVRGIVGMQCGRCGVWWVCGTEGEGKGKLWRS